MMKSTQRKMLPDKPSPNLKVPLVEDQEEWLNQQNHNVNAEIVVFDII